MHTLATPSSTPHKNYTFNTALKYPKTALLQFHLLTGITKIYAQKFEIQRNNNDNILIHNTYVTKTEEIQLEINISNKHIDKCIVKQKNVRISYCCTDRQQFYYTLTGWLHALKIT